MNLIQFLIFMQMWLISLPAHTRVYLSSLKALAFLEFIPYEWLSGESSTQNSSIAEETGIDRFGSNNLVNGLGSFLVIAIVLGVIILLTLVLRLVASRSEFLMKIYKFLKNKFMYNSMLRFVLQNSLKLQVAACTVIAYNRLTTQQDTEETKKV